MNGLAGAVVWAVVPYVPEAPFRLYAGREQSPIDVPEATALISAARKGSDSEFTFLVPGKARPVLIVSDRVDPRLGELLALRLVRLSTFSLVEMDVIRADDAPGLFPLSPERFDLPEENAAIVAALVRVHPSALDPRPVGQLDRSELRTIHGRITTHYGLDLNDLVRAELRRLADAQRRRSDPN